MIENTDDFIEYIKKNEGYRTKPYDDATGKELKSGDKIVGKITIGVGRNLSDRGLSDDEVEFLLKNDIVDAYKDVVKVFGENVEKYPNNIVLVLVDMMFNLGLPRFKQFKKFIQAIKSFDYEKAIYELEDSRWCKQVKMRCQRNKELLRREL